MRDQAASVNRTSSTLTAPAAAMSAGLRESLQNGRNALTAANVGSCTWAPPPGAAAAGCQSRITNVDATTAQFAGRMIGPSGVSGPPGDVTGIGGAAIAKRRLLRVEESAPSTNEAPLSRERVVGLPVRSNEQAPAIDARPAWPPQRVTCTPIVRTVFSRGGTNTRAARFAPSGAWPS